MMSTFRLVLNIIPHIRNQRDIPMLLEEELIHTRLTPCSFNPDNILQVRRVDILFNYVEPGDIPARLGAKDDIPDFRAQVSHICLQYFELCEIDLQDKPKTMRLKRTPSHFNQNTSILAKIQNLSYYRYTPNSIILLSSSSSNSNRQNWILPISNSINPENRHRWITCTVLRGLLSTVWVAFSSHRWFSNNLLSGSSIQKTKGLCNPTKFLPRDFTQANWCPEDTEEAIILGSIIAFAIFKKRSFFVVLVDFAGGSPYLEVRIDFFGDDEDIVLRLGLLGGIGGSFPRRICPRKL